MFRENDHFLFYWGKGTREWCLNNYEDLRDARRSPGGEVRAPVAALLYCGHEKVPYKENFLYDWPWQKAPRWDRFNPDAKEVDEFIKVVEAA